MIKRNMVLGMVSGEEKFLNTSRFQWRIGRLIPPKMFWDRLISQQYMLFGEGPMHPFNA